MGLANQGRKFLGFRCREAEAVNLAAIDEACKADLVRQTAIAGRRTSEKGRINEAHPSRELPVRCDSSTAFSTSSRPLQRERVDLLRADIAAKNWRSVWGDTDLGISV